MERERYARVMNIVFRPEALPEVVAHFRATSVPMIVAFPGFDTLLASINRDTGRIWLASLWSSADARDASAVDPTFMQNMASYAAWMASGFNRESYDVVASSLRAVEARADGVDAPRLRLTIVPLDGDQIDEAARILTDLADPAVQDHDGFLGGAVMLARSQARALAFEVWRDQPSLVDGDDLLFRVGQRLRASGCTTLVPTIEVHELSGVYRADER